MYSLNNNNKISHMISEACVPLCSISFYIILKDLQRLDGAKVRWPGEKRDTARATSHLSRLNGECHMDRNNPRIILKYMIYYILN